MNWKSLCGATVALALLCVGASLKAADRVLLVGDSITGHSLNLEYGCSHLIRNALNNGDEDVEFVPLGGSGQTIFSWRNIIKNSYEKNFQLDIRGIDVKTEFDKGADLVIVHLGMNDALQPSIKSNDEGFDSWKREYVAFVADLRERVPGAKRFVLTPPTLLTENPYAFKNVFMDKLATIVEEVAKETGCDFYDLRADFKNVFLAARAKDPNFRITLDYVHPNQVGHQAMAVSFLNAMRRFELADALKNAESSLIREDRETKGIALFVNDVPLPEDVKKGVAKEVPIEIKGRAVNMTSFDVSARSNGAKVIAIDKINDSEFVVKLSANTTDLPTDVVVEAGGVERSVRINAPFFVLTGFAVDAYPRVADFPREKVKTPLDDEIAQGKNPTVVAADAAWICCYPDADKTGGANPNAVDFADVAPANAFDAAYLVMPFESPKAQTATLKLNSEGFSTTAIETVWLNGQEVYFGCLSPRDVRAVDSVDVKLQEGANLLVARVDHTNWQWAAAFTFENAEGLKR